MIFNNKNIKRIDHICFSGGEPTLNPNIIIYTINKIIRENLNVGEITMVTNGQILNRELLEAFNKYNEYKNHKNFDNYITEYVRITFSTDKYHNPIKQEIRDSYHKYARGIKITEKDIEEDDIYKTGFSTVGKKFNYKLDQLRYCKNGEYMESII